MKKKSPILFISTIYFLIPFFVGFVIYDNGFLDNADVKSSIKQDKIEEKRVMDTTDENVQSIDPENTVEMDGIQNHLGEDEVDSTAKMIEEPEVIEALVSVSEQLDDVNISLQDDNQKEMISLVQNSLTAYMNQDDSYKQDLSKAVDIYNTLTTKEKTQVQNTLLSNVSISELLLLKKTFGF